MISCRIKTNLGVHNGTAYKGDAEKCRTGVLEHFDPPIVEHEEDGDEAAKGAEHGDTQEDKSEGDMSMVCIFLGAKAPLGITSVSK